MALPLAITRRLARLRARAAEIDYARRRMMELKTGYVYTDETRARRARAEIHDLNKLFTDEAIPWGTDGERYPLDAPHEDRRHDWPGLQ